ncbi:MAG TPA: hypothetical protein DIC64_04160 [Alphaproteobacteria bacterium]|nr:hypothetical protein [Alphaproteobacteria bacterium]
MKRFFLSLIIMVSPFIANAEIASGNDCGKECSWSISDDGTLTILGKGDMKNWSASQTPWAAYASKVNSIKVGEGITSIGNWAFFVFHASEISLPNTLTSIGASAITWMDNLKELHLPDSLLYVGNGAFYGLTELENIVIPDSVISIGADAFGRDYKLKSITIGDKTILEGDPFKDPTDDRVYTGGQAQGGTVVFCTGQISQCKDNFGDYRDKVQEANKKTINGVTYVYDKNGNLVVKDGKRFEKRIYTVEEAAAVSKPTGNTFKLRYK